MATLLTAPASALPLFILVKRFQEFGLPGKSRAYELNRIGLLELSQDLAGRTGVTLAEAQRYFGCNRPLAEVKRDPAANRARRARKVAQ